MKSKDASSQCLSWFHAQAPGYEVPKNGGYSSKSRPEKQSKFLIDELESLLEEEKQDKRKVFFVDAAHFVMSAFLEMLWCFERLFLKSSSGRKRYNVLGAFSVKGTDLVTITNDAYINSDTIVDLLIKLKQAYPDIPLTLVMDNARYQRCHKVTEQESAGYRPSVPSSLLPQFELDWALVEIHKKEVPIQSLSRNIFPIQSSHWWMHW